MDGNAVVAVMSHVLIPHRSPSHTSTGLTYLSVTRTNAGYPLRSTDRRSPDGNGDGTAISSDRTFLNLKLYNCCKIRCRVFNLRSTE
jgi:hypothetical protein